MKYTDIDPTFNIQVKNIKAGTSRFFHLNIKKDGKTYKYVIKRKRSVDRAIFLLYIDRLKKFPYKHVKAFLYSYLFYKVYGSVPLTFIHELSETIMYRNSSENYSYEEYNTLRDIAYSLINDEIDKIAIYRIV